MRVMTRMVDREYGWILIAILGAVYLIQYLLDHDAIGPSQLQPAGEVKGVHPAQDQGKDHDGQVRLDPRQVEGR